jgi:hypothetical protein
VKGPPWTEAEVQAAVKGYFSLLRAQERGGAVNKTALYRELSKAFPHGSVGRLVEK